MDRLDQQWAGSLIHFPAVADYRLGPEEYAEHVSRVKSAVHIPVVASLNGTSANLGTATVASIAHAPSAGVTFVNRDVPSGDGLVHAESARSFGTVMLEVPMCRTRPRSTSFSSSPQVPM